MADLTIRAVVDSMSEEQQQKLYYVIGFALNYGERKTRVLTKYKDLTESLDDIQKKTLDYLIDEACKEK